MWQMSVFAILCVAFLRCASADTANNTFETYHTFGSNNTFFFNFYIDSKVNGLTDGKNGADVNGGTGQGSIAEIKSFLLGLTNQTGTTNVVSGINSTDDSYPVDCYDVLQRGSKTSGVYKIQPKDSESFEVYCDQLTDDGGWTVFQNRFKGDVEFYRNWADYVNGFGELDDEFWLGLEKLYSLTNQKEYQIRIDLEDFEDNTAYASYSKFVISSAEEYYQLNGLGDYEGSAGDSLSQHKGYSFTTKDKDHDQWSHGNCAEKDTGAWWYIGETEKYSYCSMSNLNGQYLGGDETAYEKGMYWYHFKHSSSYSLKKSRMMIKPVE